jgi:hypothetical protein
MEFRAEWNNNKYTKSFAEDDLEKVVMYSKQRRRINRNRNQRRKRRLKRAIYYVAICTGFLGRGYEFPDWDAAALWRRLRSCSLPQSTGGLLSGPLGI